MNQGKTGMAKKYISAVLVLLALVSMFMPWLRTDTTWLEELMGYIGAEQAEQLRETYTLGISPFQYGAAGIKTILDAAKGKVEIDTGTVTTMVIESLIIMGAIFMMTLVLILHLLGKKSKGVLALFLVCLTYGLFMLLWWVMGDLKLTPWPYVAVAAQFASVMLWSFYHRQEEKEKALRDNDTAICPHCKTEADGTTPYCPSCAKPLK